MEDVRAMTVRLTAEQAGELEAVAQIEGAPVSEEIRKAIAGHTQRLFAVGCLDDLELRRAVDTQRHGRRVRMRG